MIQFEAGSSHSATITMTNPTSKAFDYTSILYMGITQAAMAEVSFSLAAGESKEVTFDVVMPTTVGEYPVYISVFSGGALLAQYQATEDVFIIAAPTEPFTFSNVSAQKVVFIDAPLYRTIVFHCTVTNPNNVSVTKTLKLMRGGAIYTEVSRGRLTLTLAPGQSYSYDYDGNTYDPVGDYYYGPFILGGTHYFWLEDLDGNKSPEAYV